MLIGLGDVSTLGAAIQKQEGFYSGSPSFRNNNPGNLIASSWTQQQPGYTGSDASGFAIFDTLDHGTQAMNALIQNYANRGFTIDQMMAAWAPAGQGNNDPTAYAQAVALAAGVDPSTLVSDAIAGSGSSFSASLGLPNDPTAAYWVAGIAAAGLLLYVIS